MDPRTVGFQVHITGALAVPFIVLLEQNRAAEANYGVLIGEDADDLGPALNIAVSARSGWSSALMRCCGGNVV